MAVTVASLTAHHPEFAATPPAVIQAEIDDAVLNVDSSVWGTRADWAIETRACWHLADLAYGRALRQAGDGTVNLYKISYEQAARLMGTSARFVA